MPCIIEDVVGILTRTHCTHLMEVSGDTGSTLCRGGTSASFTSRRTLYK